MRKVKMQRSPEVRKRIKEFLQYTKVAIANVILLSLCYDIYDFIEHGGKMDLANILFISATTSMVIFAAVAFDKNDFLNMSKIVISKSFIIYTTVSIALSYLLVVGLNWIDQEVLKWPLGSVIIFIVNFYKYTAPSISLQMVFVYILFVVYKKMMKK